MSDDTPREGFPRKFQHLLEKELNDVTAPTEAWITWAVCACEPDSCGWEGWMLESVSDGNHQLPIDNSRQRCPSCGKTMFRTGAQVRMTVAKNQEPRLVAGRDYDVAPMKYYDSE